MVCMCYTIIHIVSLLFCCSRIVCITLCKVRHGDSVTKPDYYYYYYYLVSHNRIGRGIAITSIAAWAGILTFVECPFRFSVYYRTENILLY